MRSLALIFVLATAACAQVSVPSSAVTSGDWQTRIAIADKLLDAGYIDAAQNDYESIIRDLAQSSPGVDRAWWGLARVHLAQGDSSSAKTAMEEVLSRNNDATSVNGCKGLYRQMKAAADAQVQQATMSVNYFQYLYWSVSWFDLFTKIFTYFDLRTAKKNLETAQTYDSSFDPHYLIDLPTIAGASASSTLSESDFAAIVAGSNASAAVHTPAPASQTTTSTSTSPTSVTAPPSTAASPATAVIGTGSVVTGSSAQGGTTAQGSSATPPAASTAQPSQTTVAAAATNGTPADLATLQRTYQEAYRKLTAAMASGDQSAVLQANTAYQKALAAYRDAASKLTSGH